MADEISTRCPACPTPPGVTCTGEAGHVAHCLNMARDPETWGPIVAGQSRALRLARPEAGASAGRPRGMVDATHAPRATGEPRPRKSPYRPEPAKPRKGSWADSPCAHLGDPILAPDGTPALQGCTSCRGTVQLKARECRHPGHAASPRATEPDCRRCRDFEAADALGVWPTAPPDMGTLPVPMVAPSQRRPGIMRGGIVQILVTRACDLACTHCTQGSNLGGKPVVMTPDEFEAAVRSLEGYPGVIGVFGGNACLSPHFDAYCRVLRARVPFEQRGLWTNNLVGKGPIARITFDPSHSNLNVHLSDPAYYEFIREWPESAPYLKGHDRDSVHGAPFVAMKDVVPDEAERWRLIGDCDVNRWWSALVGVVPGRGLRAYFCELAYAQAALHAGASDADDWPDVGLRAEPGWWRRPMADFEAQVRQHCMACGIPLRRPGRLAAGGEADEFSETHRTIARPKLRGHRVDFVEIGGMIERPARPATDYLPNTTPTP